MVRDIDIKVRWAYLNLKRKIALQFTLYFLALLLAMTLIMTNFIYNNMVLKAWSFILILLLMIKIAYDTVENMRREYSAFKAQHGGKLPL